MFKGVGNADCLIDDFMSVYISEFIMSTQNMGRLLGVNRT